MRWPVLVAALAVFSVSNVAFAQMPHEHHQPAETCADLTLACAGTVSPAFGPDGALWVAARVNNQIFVASRSIWRLSSPPVVITPDAGTSTGVRMRDQKSLSIAVERSSSLTPLSATRNSTVNYSSRAQLMEAKHSRCRRR